MDLNLPMDSICRSTSASNSCHTSAGVRPVIWSSRRAAIARSLKRPTRTDDSATTKLPFASGIDLRYAIAVRSDCGSFGSKYFGSMHSE